MGIPVVLGQIGKLLEAPDRAAALASDRRAHGPDGALDQSCVVEQGTHAELVAAGGLRGAVAPLVGRPAVALGAMTALDYILCLAKRTWELRPENLTRAF